MIIANPHCYFHDLIFKAANYTATGFGRKKVDTYEFSDRIRFFR